MSRQNRHCQPEYLEFCHLRIHCFDGHWSRIILPGQLHGHPTARADDRVDERDWFDEYL